MRNQRSIVVATIAAALYFSASLFSQDRISGGFDSNARFSLPNSVHPAIAAATSSSQVDPGFALDHMVLVLQPSATQQAALDLLTTQQQDALSPNFHRFLTPDQFASSFGASLNDLNKITGWLESNGFHIDEVASNRLAIVFSGNATQVSSTFKTEIRQYTVNGEKHYANATAPEIPTAMSGVVQGFLKLHDFHSKPASRSVPVFTAASGSHYLSPADYGIIYDLNPLFTSGINGASQTIAVLGRSNVNPTDIASFRSTYGLSANTVTPVLASGTDPGFTDDSDAMEATLDVEWAAAIAPNAAIKLVIAPSSTTTDGIDLAAQYAVTHNTASIISVSFGSCESVANNAFYGRLWQQAAAQGISVLVSAGDSGAAGCDSSTASTGTLKAVNALCTTPYNTCVGGSMFDDTSSPAQYWLPGNNATMGSAISYIPEKVWNESALTSGGSGLAATGGGPSSVYIKPYWQTGNGVPADGRRDIPDISLSAAGDDGYLIYYNGATQAVAGTSAATPAFAGILALITQKYGGAQGQVNQILYPLAAKAPKAFHDITSGNNSVPGIAGYSATAGYDLASGLGSVDANQLAANWTSATNGFSFFPSATSVTASPGQNGTLTLNVVDSNSFQSSVALSAGVMPAGVVASFAPDTIAGSGSTTASFSVSSWATSGIYPVTITATGGGITRTASFNLAVVVATNCTLTSAPATLTVLQSQSGSVKIACGNSQGVFSSNLSLSVSGMPTGVTAAFTPSSIAAQTGAGSLVASVSAHATPGTYALVVTATLPNASPAFTRTLTVPLTVTAPYTFNVAASTYSVSLAQGASATLALTSTHNGSFNSSLSFAATGLPSSVSAALSPASIAAPGDGSSTVTLQATSMAVPGVYTMLVVAAGGGLSLQIPITVQVTAAPAFTLTTAGAVMTLRQSSTAAITVTTGTLTGNFNLPVSLSVTGLPTGVTAAFSPALMAAPGSGSSVLTLTASATAVTGVSTITVTAMGGIVSHYANIQLTLTPPPTFALSASLPSYNMIAGASLTENISSTGLYGYTSNINLSVSTLPTGISATFPATTISGAYGMASMTVQTATSLAAGSYTVTVTGTDPVTSISRTTSVTLLVGNVTTSISSSSISLAPAGSATATITVVAQSYTGTVALSLGTLPLGVTYSLSAPYLNGAGISTLTISAAASTLPGTYPVTLRSIADGVTKTTIVTIVVT